MHESLNAAGYSRRFQSPHADSVSGGAPLKNICCPRAILPSTPKSRRIMNPDPSPFTHCISLEDPCMGSGFSQHHKGVGCLGHSRLFPLQLKSGQWHSCGLSECQNIAISAVTAKLCLAWPEFLGIKTEAQATTNTHHSSSRPEPSRCLSKLDTFTTNALRLNTWLPRLSLLLALCVYQEEWVILLHDAHRCCKGGHPYRSNRAERRMCAHIHAQCLFSEQKLQDEPDKGKMYIVKRCNSACKGKCTMKTELLYEQGPVFKVALMCNLGASIRKHGSSCCNCSTSLPRLLNFST